MRAFKTVFFGSMLAAMLGMGSSAYAEEVKAGQTEVVGFVGAGSEGAGTILGGGIQYGLGPRLLFAGELAYFTGGEDFNGFGVNVDSSIIGVNANAHYLFPMKNPKFTPYALGGLGFLRASAKASGFGVSSSASDTSIGLNIGGGARWAAGENWGIRPELKFWIGDGDNTQFTIGVYYGFGK